MEKRVVGIAVAIIFNRQNQVLITKRNSKQSFAGYWEFPGGKIEVGETAKDAAIREVKEEVCIDLNWSLTNEYHHIQFENDNFIADITYFKNTSFAGIPTLTDQLEMEWIDVNELYKYQFPKANDQVVAMLEADDKLINPKPTFPIQQSKLIHNYTDSNNINHKVLSVLVDNLKESTSFQIVVAFITNSGVSLLLPTLKELETRGITGHVITSSYLGFTDPEAVKKLDSFKNVTVYLNESNLHAKGYIFNKANSTDVLIGSSNLTSSALTTNGEWNTLTTYDNYQGNSELEEIRSAFNTIKDNSKLLSEVIDDYTTVYNANKQLNKIKQELYNTHVTNHDQVPITANTMQIEALQALKSLRDSNVDKGLVISSTGSGKTILAGLDVKQVNPSRMLFIVHRENIARKAMDTFKQIIPNRSYGLYTGTIKDKDSDYLFATIQTLVNNLDSFNTTDFDYIIIDEVHHGGAKSYQQVFDYFKPSFYLGLTATPERTDGFDIFKMFDYNIAYEYRLDRAMKDDLLAPFHYFGVSDITVDNRLVEENTSINNLTTEERIKNISNKLREYTVTNQVNGLMFVSNVTEAKQLSSKLNEAGFKTITLDATNSEDERQRAIDKLETTELDYIITVDIFNEGIDIPCVNQVVLLRPTKSAIVYVQQIGRGLRKHSSKEFVTIIDFIGNYKNNYLVPVAISNDHTYNKDKLKKDVIINGINILHGESVIQFEQIVQEQLIKQITNTKINTMANIKHDYNYLKAKLNRIPTLLDFANNNLMSPLEITKVDIYPKVVSKIEKEKCALAQNEEVFLEYITKFVLTSKRLAEHNVLSQTIEQQQITLTIDEEINAADHFAKEIFTKISDEYKYKPILEKVSEGTYRLTKEFKSSLDNKLFKDSVLDILAVSEQLVSTNDLQLNTTYTRKEAYKYLLKDFNNGYQVGGYTVFDDLALIFITLDDSNSFTQYDNELLSNNQITWFSKANRKLRDKNNNYTAEGKLAANKVDIHIFTKRNSSEEFYYLGTAYTKYIEEQTKEEKQRYKYTFNLYNTISDELYKYLTVKGE